MAILIFVSVLLVSIILGVPIAFSLLFTSLALMVYLDMFNLQIIAEVAMNGADSFTMLAIPFFVLAGEIMNVGGLSARIVDLPLKLFGHKPGGLGYVAVIAAVIMASLSGSAVADTAAVAALMVPMMTRAGYPLGTSSGLISAGGIMAPIIPPSLPFIIFGVASNVSITKLFFAGIAPGLLMGLALLVTWSFMCRKIDTELHPKATWPEVVASAKHSVWALALPVIIIGGFRLGVFTPTEAGAVAAAYSFFVAMFIYRDLKWHMMNDVLLAAGKTVAVIMFLFAASSVTAYLITLAELPDKLLMILEPLIDTPRILILAIMALVFMVGMVMDLGPMILILVPILMPVVKAADINEVYFGVLFMVNGCIGLITPPVGNALNAVTGVAKVRFDAAARGVIPYLLTHLVMLFLFIMFPELITVPMKILF